MADLKFSANPVEGAILTGGYKELGPDYPPTGHQGNDWGGVNAGVAVRCWALTPTKVVGIHEVDGQNKPLDGWGNGTLGNCVVVDHIGTPYWGFYAHLQNIGSIEVGMGLTPGAIVGYVGRTGKATGVHLHHALCLNEFHNGTADAFADPLKFLQPGLTIEQEVERLKRIVAGYGVIDPERKVRLTGEDALKFADAKGYCAMLSAQENNLGLQDLANKLSDFVDSDDEFTRDEFITFLREFADELQESVR